MPRPTLQLVRFEPQWVDAGPDRYGVGLSWDCPAHPGHRLEVHFSNPYDGLSPIHVRGLHHRIGPEPIEDCVAEGGQLAELTIEGLLDFPGHWRGWLVHGVLVTEP